jgi:hypothetical protein
MSGSSSSSSTKKTFSLSLFHLNDFIDIGDRKSEYPSMYPFDKLCSALSLLVSSQSLELARHSPACSAHRAFIYADK